MTWARFERVVAVAIVVILAITFLASVGLLATTKLHGVPHADEKVLTLGLALLFGCIVLLFLSRLVQSLDAGEVFGVESHWGGLGGGVGGWRITRPLVHLFLVITFAALMAVLLARYVDRGDTSSDDDKTATDEKTTTDKTTTEETTTGSPDGASPTSTGQTTTTPDATPESTTSTQAPAAASNAKGQT